MTKEEFENSLREQIARGEITPADAEVEMDFFLNGWDSYQSIYGW